MTTTWLVAHERLIRLCFFLAVFAAMAIWEWLAPRRRLTFARGKRWPSNLVLSVLNSVVIRFVPWLAVGVALEAQRRGWGLLQLVALPSWVEVGVGVLLLDLAIYAQHVAFHHVPWFWRLHRVHHADPDIDVTTGLRFHPLEIVLSMGFKMALVAAFGIAAPAVVVFEVLLNATSLFNHSNVILTGRVDSVLRLFVVTPDQHRVHHSVLVRETNSNFAFNLSLWDRIFGTYRAQPQAGHEKMKIGLADITGPSAVKLTGMLWLPFKN